MCGHSLRGQKKASDLQKLKLQTIVSLPTWVLETGLKPSTRVVCEPFLQLLQYIYCSFVPLLKWTVNFDSLLHLFLQALFCL